jgi:hypothetical protein
MTQRPEEIIAEVIRRESAREARAILYALHAAGYRVVSIANEPSLFDDVSGEVSA